MLLARQRSQIRQLSTVHDHTKDQQVRRNHDFAASNAEQAAEHADDHNRPRVRARGGAIVWDLLRDELAPAGRDASSIKCLANLTDESIS